LGVKDILKRVYTKEKKVVLCGLDSAGKTTMVTFLQSGTFIEHTPTMRKELTTMEVQGTRLNLMDMGGQSDFRDIWFGEASEAECVIFMIDASAKERFSEAREELWKLFDILKKKPLIVIANKCDLTPAASLGDIINALGLEDLPSFEIIPISSKTGVGIINAFMKIYYKLTGKPLRKRINTKAFTVFDQGGIPLTSSNNEDILQGGLFTAINCFTKESFNSELNQLKMGDHVIIFKRSKNLMGSIVLKDSDRINVYEAEEGLNELLIHLEHMCPEIETNDYDMGKIGYLAEQYASNLL